MLRAELPTADTAKGLDEPLWDNHATTEAGAASPELIACATKLKRAAIHFFTHRDPDDMKKCGFLYRYTDWDKTARVMARIGQVGEFFQAFSARH